MSTGGIRDDTRNYVLVGAFVLAALAALLAWIALLSGRTGAMDHYVIVYSSVMGLSEGAPVTFQGYRIGTVEEIGPAQADGGRGFEVAIAVRRGWPIPENSIARMVTSGLLAAVVIDIRAGDSGQVVEPGGRIAGREREDVFVAVSQVAGRLGDFVADLEPLMDALEEGAPGILADARSLTGKLNETADRLNEIVSSANSGRVSNILREFESASRSAASLARELESTRKGLDDLLVEVDGTVRENRGDLRQSILDLRDTLAAFARGADVLSVNLETASQNIAEFSDDLRRDPSVLVRGREAGDEP